MDSSTQTLPEFRIHLLAILLFTLAATGCTGLFLQPDRNDYFPQAKELVRFEEGFIPTPDGERLHYWILPAQQDKEIDPRPKGLVILCHGNAQNLSSHVRNLGWITERGYSLAIFDYRGYGKSTGHSNLSGAFHDVQTALDFFTLQKNPLSLPVVFYGQSLGGTLLLKAASSQPRRWTPKMIVIESAFFSYPQIAREKLASLWLTWPLQWISYLAVSDSFSLERNELASLAPIPVSLYYSENDPIVPDHNGDEIYQSLREPRRLTKYPESGHIAAMYVRKGFYRRQLLESLATAAAQ